MSTIELRAVTKTASKHAVSLDRVSLKVTSGKSLAIVGPTGGGKSLLLRILAGIENATDGDLLIDDALVNAVGPRDRDFSMVFQEFDVYHHLNVFDNMAFSAKLRKGVDRSALSERIHEAAELLGLSDRLDAKASVLTESERQRVALGRALVRDATAYLFDDAFSTLDERSRSHVRAMTTQWQKDRGRTSIYVTDDVLEALSLGDEVAVLHQGFVQQCASPRELYERPVNMFVASLMGTPPMNLVPALVKSGRLELPVASLPLEGDLADRIGDREMVIVGIRPEDCAEVSGGEISSATMALSAKVDEVEWRGNEQYAYLGFDVSDEVADRLQEVEDHIEFDMFQTHVVASLPAAKHLTPGMSLRLFIDTAKIHIFDVVTGDNLSLG